MQLNSNFLLYHPLWEKADTDLVHSLGLYRRLIDVFVIACAIGIQEDKIIPAKDITEPLENAKEINKSTYQSASNADLDDVLNFMFQNAIINTSHLDWDSDKRLKVALDPDCVIEKFRPTEFLISFANYGIVQIFQHVNQSTHSAAIIQKELNDYYQEIVDKNYYEGIELHYNLD